MPRRALLTFALLASLGVASCAATETRPAAARPATPPAAVPRLRLEDAAPALGVDDTAWSGSLRLGKIIASVGGGMAWLDYDGDGDHDLLLTEGQHGQGAPIPPNDCARLLRNDAGHFREVTATTGLAACGWGMGVLAEDLDADGAVDLLLTFLGETQLWRNRDDGSFERVPDAGGASLERWNTGAAALDADGDGDLDLFVASYLDTTYAAELARPAFRLSTMDEFEPQPDALFENLGGLRFRPVEGALDGVPPGRGLTVAAADLDGDGRPEVFVANDRDRNTLLRLDETGRLEDVTLQSGTGWGLTGREEAGMGLAVGDADGDGLPDVLVTNYAGEPVNLFTNLGDLTFQDTSREAGLYGPTFEWLGWSAGLDDLDADGRSDLWVANGHLVPQWVVRLARLADRRQEVSSAFVGTYHQPALVFAGDAGGSFRAPVEPVGRRGVWRGGDAADFDLDGDLDVFLYSADRTTPSLLLRNASELGGWLAVDPRAPGRPPLPSGLTVAASGPAGERTAPLVSGGSYLSGSAVPLHLGLGDSRDVDLELRTAGAAERHLDMAVGRTYVVAP